eukprot:CAMPEP_0173365580 /NCGR_PEP_ID=MMETSP1144-20121109/23706_1 /TAXON_ID=483371 /ORGANISM="non described non described, Strain CCMP2298" /LENGTH=147 /DNA_ID=CAMNT_0014316029 /DNA_START=275 /DNA_END=716 /DNA_ORIENTATION=+
MCLLQQAQSLGPLVPLLQQQRRCGCAGLCREALAPASAQWALQQRHQLQAQLDGAVQLPHLHEGQLVALQAQSPQTAGIVLAVVRTGAGAASAVVESSDTYAPVPVADEAAAAVAAAVPISALVQVPWHAGQLQVKRYRPCSCACLC